MSVQTYYLQGNLAKVQDILYTPYRHSSAWINDAAVRRDRYRMTRVTEYILGCIGWFISYPLKAAGDLLNRCSEQIPSFEKKQSKWATRFKTNNKDTYQDQIIELLIRSRVKPKECSFQNIHVCCIRENCLQNYFRSDAGEHRMIAEIINNPTQCLIIGHTHDEAYFYRTHSTTETSIEGDADDVSKFRAKQIKSMLEDEMKQKLPLATWFWLGLDQPGNCSLARREQIVQLFKKT